MKLRLFLVVTTQYQHFEISSITIINDLLRPFTTVIKYKTELEHCFLGYCNKLKWQLKTPLKNSSSINHCRTGLFVKHNRDAIAPTLEKEIMKQNHNRRADRLSLHQQEDYEIKSILRASLLSEDQPLMFIQFQAENCKNSERPSNFEIDGQAHPNSARKLRSAMLYTFHNQIGKRTQIMQIQKKRVRKNVGEVHHL